MKDVIKDLIAGTIGGAGGIVVGHPIDTVKVRLQVDRSYGGVMDCVTKTLRNEGPTSFYKGVVAPVLGAAPINAVVFVVYGGVIRWAATHHARNHPENRMGFQGGEPNLPLYYHTLAGCMAGASQNVFGTPNELVKIKCQMHREGDMGSLQMGKILLRQSGTRGLFQGFWLSLWRDMPAFGIYFTTYEFTRQRLQETGLTDMWAVFFAGGIAGASSFFWTHPVDVVKSLRQEQCYKTPTEQTRVFTLTRELYRYGGARAFTRGLGPSVFRAFPVSAVTFLIYDTLLDILPLEFLDFEVRPPRRLQDDLNYLL